jgi:hypothetical protein
MDQPCLKSPPRDGRRVAVLLQNRDTFVDALVAYIRGCAGYKTRYVGGTASTERAAQAAHLRQPLAGKLGNAAHDLIPDSPRHCIPRP